MVNSTESSTKDVVPVFIPPRRRQSSKKLNGNQKYVDHIVTVQGRTKQSPTSPSSEQISGFNIMKLPIVPTSRPASLLEVIEDDCPPRQQKLSPFRDMNSINVLIETDKPKTAAVVLQQKRQSLEISPKYSDDKDVEGAHYEKDSGVGVCQQRSSLSKKRVNISTDTDKNQKSSSAGSQQDDQESLETSILNDHSSLDHYQTLKSENYLTMTGTVKRGRKKGQSVDLQLNISREELEQIHTAALVAVQQTKQGGGKCCSCSKSAGIHILLLSLLCLPFVTVLTSMYSFYIGTLTWYNMFNYFNEEKSYIYKLLMSPLLIITYPVGIVLCTIGLGIYAGIIQLSICFSSWINEIGDIEKGFYGWLCSFLHLSDCSPYEVVILTDLQMPSTNDVALHPGHGHSSTEELSL